MRITKDIREWGEFYDDSLRLLRRLAAWAALGFAGLGAARAVAWGATWEAQASTALSLALSAVLVGRTKRRERNFRLACLAVAALATFGALCR